MDTGRDTGVKDKIKIKIENKSICALGSMSQQKSLCGYYLFSFYHSFCFNFYSTYPTLFLSARASVYVHVNVTSPTSSCVYKGKSSAGVPLHILRGKDVFRFDEVTSIDFCYQPKRRIPFGFSFSCRKRTFNFRDISNFQPDYNKKSSIFDYSKVQ